MKNIRGISTKLVAVILVLIAGGAAAVYILSTDFPMRVMEPLSITAHPETLSIYPNTTTFFNITVDNAASVNYLATLTFSLNDTAYQQTYVTFSNTTYNIIPGTNNLTASATIAADAPPALLQLTVGLSRVNEAQPTFGYTFTWNNQTQNLVNETITMKLDFTLTDQELLIAAQVNYTTLWYDDSTHLGIVFDSEFDGIHENDTGLMFFFGNTYYNGYETWMTPEHFLMGNVHHLPLPSPYHNCTFDNATGYTFNIRLPKSVIPQKNYYSEKALCVHVDFVSNSWRRQPDWDDYLGSAWVYTEFSFENFPFGVPT